MSGSLAWPVLLGLGALHGLNPGMGWLFAVDPGGAAPLDAIAATLAHTAGYLLVCGIVAAVVYRRFGLRWLRRGWVNLDAAWAVALVVTAVLTVVVGG